MATADPRIGVTLPFEDVTLTEHRPLLRGLVEAGLTEIWTGEVNALDGFGPLSLFRGWEDEITISCAAASVFTRGPAVLAMTAAAMAETAPGACRFGIGAGSRVVAQEWNGAQFRGAWSRTVETLRFVRAALAGERLDNGFRLARPVAVPPRLLLAVAGPRMQDFAAAEADTMALNFVSADDVARIRARVAPVERRVSTSLETAVRLFLVPDDGPQAEAVARRFLAGYLTVPTYASFQTWLGRGDDLAAMNAAWQAGDRRGAVAAIGDDVLRDLVLFGSPEVCAAAVRGHLDAGADVVTLALVPGAGGTPQSRVDFLADLARHASL